MTAQANTAQLVSDTLASTGPSWVHLKPTMFAVKHATSSSESLTATGQKQVFVTPQVR